MLFPLFLLIFISAGIAILSVLIALLRSILKRTGHPVISSDGHRIPPSKDITCAAYGHTHPESAPRYIVHEDPENGYVILNGVKRKITDCKYL